MSCPLGADRVPSCPACCRATAGIDGAGLRLLTPDSADHTVTRSPSGEHFVDSYSTPVTVLREMEGDVVVELERADTQAMAELGFVVVEVDAMGTPWRSEEFHDAYYLWATTGFPIR